MGNTYHGHNCQGKQNTRIPTAKPTLLTQTAPGTLTIVWYDRDSNMPLLYGIHTWLKTSPNWTMYRGEQQDLLQTTTGGPAAFTTMLDTLGWDSLQTRRQKGRLRYMNKIVSGRVAVGTDDYLEQGSH